MDTADIIGFAGVALILVAFVGNLAGSIERLDLSYLLLNLVGASLACLSSALIGFLPFVLLEGVWAVAALAGLAQRARSA